MSRVNWHFVLVAVSLWIAGTGLGCSKGNAEGPGASSASESSGGEDEDGDDEVPAPTSVVRKQGSGSVAAVIGRPGGTLELSQGPRVEIPAGAVEGGQEFVLKVAQKTTVFGNKESEKAVGPTFSFAPGLNAPDGASIIVSFPLGTVPEGWGEPSIAYEVDEGAIGHGEDSTRTKWQYENASLQGGRIVAKMPGLTGLRMQFVLTNLEVQ